MKAKEIVVNDPLVYNGVRFYQSSFGETGKIDKLSLAATPNPAFNPASADANSASGTACRPQRIFLPLGDTADLDADTTVRFAEFFSDFAVRDGQVYKRSNDSAIRPPTWS